ncbi:unnamed protein product [Coregonus sp. 'balchen']|nr:unnamed protein product [Coregonus sp. 'balchen']
MEQTVVLITGCSSGIGLSLAVRLASDPAKMYKVYATMRNLAKKERLLDCVKGLHKDTLDILQLDITDQGQILEVNLLGTISTIQAFLPGMKAQGHGRILVTGSIGGLKGLPFNEVYCASKFAVEGACESLAILLQHFNIHVSLIECGPVNTDFLDNPQRAEPGDCSLQQVDAHTRSLYDTYLQHCGMVFQNAAQDTEDIVKVFLDAIQSSNPAFRYYTNNALLPLSSPKISALDGSQYIRTMSKIIFSTNGKEEQK